MNHKYKDITGMKFGRLTAIEKVEPRRPKSGTWWRCVCDCGEEVIVQASAMRSGNTKSCGCLHTEMNKRKRGVKSEEHGERICNIRDGMIRRCYNKNEPAYKWYGARGITVCDEWLRHGGRRAFYDWSIENGYRDDLSIDRIDNNGPYAPWNCRWATTGEQSRNNRRNRIIEFNGESHVLMDWEKITGVKRETIAHRLNIGWSVEDALRPVDRRRREAT